MKKMLPILVVFMFIALLIGCSRGDEQKKSTDNNKQELADENEIEKEEAKNPSDEKAIADLDFLTDIPEVPTSAADLVAEKKGEFSIRSANWNDEVLGDLKKELSNLLPLPKNPTEEEYDLYFKYMYSLIADEFPDPEETIKKWEFGAFGNPDLPDSRFHFKDNYNVEVLLDASGSMGASIGDETMMQIAKESIHDFMKQVPEDANVSFRVYGHKGSGSESDKQISCESIEQVYGYDAFDEKKFQAELDKIKPAGWTPLAGALQAAEKGLKKYDTNNNTNLIYVVSDGVETCGGDPVKVAKSLADSNAKPIINIIGFNVDEDARKQLKEMADVSGGIYSNASNQEQLKEEFDRAEEVLDAWEDWKEGALKDVSSMETRSHFDILHVKNRWSFTILGMSNNLKRVARVLENEEYITYEQKKVLRKKIEETIEHFEKIEKDIENELKDLSVKKITQQKKEIEKKYNNNTNE